MVMIFLRSLVCFPRAPHGPGQCMCWAQWPLRVLIPFHGRYLMYQRGLLHSEQTSDQWALYIYIVVIIKKKKLYIYIYERHLQ